MTSRGHGRVVRRLVGLRLEGRVPSHGDALLGKERDIGLITSATYSPGLSAPIALGYVHRDFVEPGTRSPLDTTDRDRHGDAVAVSHLGVNRPVNVRPKIFQSIGG